MVFKDSIRVADTRRWAVLASPIVVVLVGHLTARLCYSLWGNWAWVGSSLVYWSCCLAIPWALGDKTKRRTWFDPSQGSRWWIVLALGMGLVAFPLLFIPNLGVMQSAPLVIAWFLFAVVNATAEEVYWRGFLLDETAYLPRSVGVIYSSVLFVAIHPLMLGMFSKIQAFDPAQPLALLPFMIILVTLALVYCLLYLKTKSLRLPIFSHFLTDLGNMSIFLFMNMVGM